MTESTDYTPLSEVPTVNGLGWEWSSQKDGTTYQVAWTGGLTLLYGWRPAGGEWTEPVVMDRARWGVDGTADDARAKVAEFYEATTYVHRSPRPTR